MARGDSTSRPITSVVSWRGAYGPVSYQGKTYELRAREFRKFAALPACSTGPFELALDIHSGDAQDIDLLRGHGWSLVQPRDVAGDPWCYGEYIRNSAAELMVAKNMYVETKSGWVSDRSICYLASGRPVIAQDTGVGEVLPTGEGFVTFASLEEAAEATRAVRREPQRHQRAARRLAEEYFDSSIVLRALAERLELR
jgi:glycosyltransferase involved in cell wall biosynthesis